MANPSKQQQEFQDRIARINHGGGKAAQARIAPKRGGKKAKKQKQVGHYAGAQNQNPNIIIEAFMMIVAFLVGAFSILAGKVIVFHLVSDNGIYQLDEGLNLFAGMFGDIIIGVILSMILGAMLRVNYGARFWAEFSGFAMLLWFDGILMEAFPEVFAKLFSARYVLEYLYF